jgi:hypothetical protein
MDIALIVTVVSCTAAGVWLLRSAVGGVEKALAVHVVEESTGREALTARVVKLERRRR